MQPELMLGCRESLLCLLLLSPIRETLRFKRGRGEKSQTSVLRALFSRCCLAPPLSRSGMRSEKLSSMPRSALIFLSDNAPFPSSSSSSFSYSGTPIRVVKLMVDSSGGG